MRQRAHLIGYLLLAAAAVGGCRRDQDSSNAAPSHDGPTGVRGTARLEITIDFPPELRVADPSVNEFVHKVLATCASGDYDRFRLLWSALEEPFPRDRYERAWRSVRRVRLLDLKPMRNARDGQIVYIVHATAELDESVPKPEREIVVVLVGEHDGWRLMKPPRNLRNQMLANSAEAESQPDRSKD